MIAFRMTARLYSFRKEVQAMRDRGMRSGTELAGEIQLTDWSTTGNLSNRFPEVQIPFLDL